MFHRFRAKEVSEIFTTSVRCAARGGETKVQNKFCRDALKSAHPCASPGIRVSRSGLRREFKTIALQTTKNPPELAGSGGSVRTDVSISLTRDRSHQPGRRYRSACSRSTVLRDFSKIRFASPESCLLANRCSREAREINLVPANVN